MNNTTQKKGTTDFNPLSWAILFFSLWYTLRPLHNYLKFSWFLFGISIILLSSIYCGWLYRKLSSPKAVTMILPTIFTLTIAVFIFGVLLALKDLSAVDQIIAVSLSFVLLGTWLMVCIASLNRMRFRVVICIIIIILFAVRLAYSGFGGSWPLIILIAQSIWATIAPDRFRNIPLV